MHVKVSFNKKFLLVLWVKIYFFLDVCLASRAYALHQRKIQNKDLRFIPKCRADGSYAPVQCLESAGCWCVNPLGKPIPHTRVTFGNPACAQKSKSNQRRSSPRQPGLRNKRSKSPMFRLQAWFF